MTTLHDCNRVLQLQAPDRSYNGPAVAIDQRRQVIIRYAALLPQHKEDLLFHKAKTSHVLPRSSSVLVYVIAPHTQPAPGYRTAEPHNIYSHRHPERRPDQTEK
jgi:hypothetical protein